MGWRLVLSIVVLILLVYAHAAWSQSNRRHRIRRLIADSSGTFDDSAAEALRELEALEIQEAEDHYAAGNIIRYNLQENNPVLAPGAAAVHYIRAARALDPAAQNAPIIAHGVEEFDRIVRIYGAEDQMVRGLHAVAAQIPAVNRESAQARIKRAVEAAPTRKAAVEAYFDQSVQYTNDQQNVHDSKVSSDLRETLARLKASGENVPTDAAFTQIERYLRGEFARAHPDKAGRALVSLEKARAGEYISTFNDREDEILARVWARAGDRRNADNESNIREAVALALADSATTGGSTVCINGRVGRVLGSLATLDYDPTVGSAMTFEAYRNQIFQETKDIIAQEIEAGKRSSDADIRAAAEAYDGGDDAPADASEAFSALIGEKIEQNLAQYEGKLADWELHNIADECKIYAAV